MNQNIEIKNHKCRLRNVRLDDAEFIVRLRNQERARGKIGSTDQDVDKQVNWLVKYLQNVNDYYFIIENNAGECCGTYGIYDITGSTAYLGRWVMMPNTQVAMDAHYLILDFGFHQLNLDVMKFTVVETNKKVIRFHKLMGAVELGMDEHPVSIDGVEVRQYLFEYRKSDWPGIKNKILEFCKG